MQEVHEEDLIEEQHLLVVIRNLKGTGMTSAITARCMATQRIIALNSSAIQTILREKENLWQIMPLVHLLNRLSLRLDIGLPAFTTMVFNPAMDTQGSEVDHQCMEMDLEEVIFLGNSMVLTLTMVDIL
ncbi:hypothetical protein AABB24_009482 [Solanum stoloniferum]|uniref:Uncharacterized protein n=1 Tax=Solanum stoloniferum TaxID=62892 RepID=A0ABD2UM61_9SOLN